MSETNQPVTQLLADLAGAIVGGGIRVVDLTVPLEPATPTIQLPPPFAPSKPFSLEEISRYDERGPAWYWNNIACGEHTGTHFDAPIHWVTGKDYANNATHNIPVERFIGPACVIDVAAEAKANPDFLLTREIVEEWEAQARPHSHACLGSDPHRLVASQGGEGVPQRRPDGSHTPGFHPQCVPFLAKERDILGVGVETVGTDAGQALRLRAHVSLPYHHARLEPLRSREPHQSRQAAADRRHRHRAAAEDRQRLGQSAARARRSCRHEELSMAERSFAKEVESLRLGEGEEFHGEGILAVTKALLQSGVAYVGGYQGAPISHLMDVLADAEGILNELGVHFEASASEATAAAMLSASINYPLRGAVTWKSTVGTNVASDALANLASSGVKGGALIILGEDYGEGASIMQERTHAFAMKSQMWLLDPRPHLPTIVRAVEQAFELSEASNTPVMLMLRIRACHVYGHFKTKQNRRPAFSAADALAAPSRDYSRIILPPSTYAQEREKIEVRLPAAQRFVAERGLNEIIDARGGRYRHRHAGRPLQQHAARAGTARLCRHVRHQPRAAVPAQRHLSVWCPKSGCGSAAASAPS
jgi:kynurenine formamidase